MYPSSNIVCYLHYPICLTLLACLPLWVPQDLVPCHPWNLRTHWCKWRNLCRLKLKFSHRTKSSCSCPVHRTPVMWSGLVCTYSLFFSGLVCNTRCASEETAGIHTCPYHTQNHIKWVWYLPVPIAGTVLVGTGAVRTLPTCTVPMRNPSYQLP